MKNITSRDNPEYRRLLRLATSGKTRRTLQQILLDGSHLIEAYAQAFGAQAMTLVARASSAESEAVQGWVDAGHACLVLADGLFKDIAPVDTPTGLMAVAPLPPVPKPRPGGFSVFMDGVQDPGNLGAILRSAAAAGAARALLSAQCADPWSPRCLRGGMGAQFVVAVEDHCDLPAAVQAFQGRVVAADPRATTSLFDASLEGVGGFVVGGEGHGVSAEVLALCAARVRIPMAAGIESLNAAAAATLLFYEWRRRTASFGRGLVG